MVSIVGPAIVMALVSVGANYVVYAAKCKDSCSAWLPFLLSEPAGELGIIISAALFMGSIVAFLFSKSFGISKSGFWVVMPACLVLAVSMASVPFIFLLAALPPDFELNNAHLALIDIFSFLLLGAFSVLTAATTAEAPEFSRIIGSLHKGDAGSAPGSQEENKDHPRSDANGAAGNGHAPAGEAIEPVAESSSPTAASQAGGEAGHLPARGGVSGTVA